MVGNKVVALGLDVGERRIGVAVGDSIIRIAQPIATLPVDGSEVTRINGLLKEYEVTQLVVGLPRNQSGEETKQSEWVRHFVAAHLTAFDLPIAFQDESVTSVLAEAQLKARGGQFTKADIDAEAACLILQDYLEASHG
jgi:putative Holliday junction resolvase